MSQRECANLVTRDGEPVMLQGVTASGDLRGLLFEASILQRFCNPTEKNMVLRTMQIDDGHKLQQSEFCPTPSYVHKHHLPA